MIIASIDIGSNTVLLLIAKVNVSERTIVALRDEQMIPRLSEGLAVSGEINNNSVIRLMSVLSQYYDLIHYYKCEKVIISATNAFRIASNRDEIRSLIRNEFGTEVNVLSGEEEAELGYIGIMSYGKQKEYRLVIDIGGGSTEIILGNMKNSIYKKSMQIGVVSLADLYSREYSNMISMQKFIKRLMDKENIMLPFPNNAPVKGIALAGTPVTLACIKKGLKNYDQSKVEGSKLTKSDVLEISRYLEMYSPKELLQLFPRLLEGREDLILIGTYILLYIIELFDLNEILVSTKGLRYGAIYKYIFNESDNPPKHY